MADENNKPVFSASPSGGMVASLTELSDEDIVKKQATGDSPGGENQQTGNFFVPDNNRTEVLVGGNLGGIAGATGAMPDAAQGVAAMEVAKAPEKKGLPIWLIILLAVVGLGIVGFVAWYFFLRPKPTPVVQAPQAQVLDYWGLWETSEALDKVLREFESTNPGISVNYTKQSIVGYRQSLQNALQNGVGPDVFRYHAAWVPELQDQLATSPESAEQFKMSYYPVMAEQLIVGEETEQKVVGVPLMYDGLALIYNKAELEAKDVEVPRTWGEFQLAATKLTETTMQTDEEGNEVPYIEFAGAAIGLADNVDNFSDILALLIVQNSGDLENLNSSVAMDALDFYGGFYNPPAGNNVRVWDESFDSSAVAFARGEVAMIFAPSWTIHDILAINPTLDLGVAPVPQLDDHEPVTVATYWVEGVNAKSERQAAAWKLLQYLSRADVLATLNAEQSRLRYFGEIYPRPDMADQLAGNPYVQPYVSQAPYAVANKFVDKTFDEGLADGLVDAMKIAVNAVAQGREIERVIEELNENVGGVLSRYTPAE